MKLIETSKSVGHVLCHDITQIIKDVKKGVVFKKGHVVQEEDIPVLLSVGKEHLCVWEKQEGVLHENEAAEILYKLCATQDMSPTTVKEGKIEVVAEIDGLFKVDIKRLEQINSLDDIMIASRYNNYPVKKGDKLAGTRIIPLVIEEKRLQKAVDIAGNEPLFKILPYKKSSAAIVTTGSEIFHGRIKDAFGSVIRQKLSEYDVEILGQEIVDDNQKQITESIEKFIQQGAQLIICTGGMSVDPDDLTPSAIKATGTEIVTYGAPVLPGAMFLLSYYKGEIPIIGLPGCVMYAKRTIFDLILPRIMVGEKLEKQDFSKMGHGGLCLSCEKCNFPNCGFGASMG